MSQPHRGLPPPHALTLNVPAATPGLQPPPASAISSAFGSGQLPPAPSSWSGPAEDNMRVWFQAKLEEDRRRQEEEKTKQEHAKLEIRKVEYTMIQDSLRAGVPPHMLPILFAGLGNIELVTKTMEFTSQYYQNLQIQQHQMTQQAGMQASEDPRRQNLGQAVNAASMNSQTVIQQQPQQQPPQLANIQPKVAGYGQSVPSLALPSMSPASKARALAQGITFSKPVYAREPTTVPLPRTNNLSFQTPSHLSTPSQSSFPQHPQIQPHPGQQQNQEHQQTSPNLVFHQWQPPKPAEDEQLDSSTRREDQKPALASKSSSAFTSVNETSNSPAVKKRKATDRDRGDRDRSSRFDSPDMSESRHTAGDNSTASSTPARKRGRKASELGQISTTGPMMGITSASQQPLPGGHPLSFTRGQDSAGSHTQGPGPSPREGGSGPNFPRQLLSRPLEGSRTPPTRGEGERVSVTNGT